MTARVRPDLFTRQFPLPRRDCMWTTSPRWWPISMSCGRPVVPDAELCEEHQWRMENGTPSSDGTRWFHDQPVIPASAEDYQKQVCKR
jgi:hypothetical protein